MALDDRVIDLESERERERERERDWKQEREREWAREKEIMYLIAEKGRKITMHDG